MADQDITKEILNFLFDYKDGELYWKISLSSKSPKGCIAGTKGKDGYKRIGLNRKKYLNHRFIFLMHHGYLPKIVDHIDGNSENNRIENLRPATVSQNQWNSVKNQKNTSGYKNVTWSAKLKKWQVIVRVYRKDIYIGYFEDLELADLVAQEARNKYHGEFANHS